MTDKISIIVPVYNVEKFLPQCIESICNQTYQNLEIILVDDGSLDSSGKICDEFSQKDGRIKVIHQVNGGVSTARNTGIENAEGTYLMFVDSDDWLSPDAVEHLSQKLENANADLAVGSYQCVFSGSVAAACLKDHIYTGEEVGKNLVELYLSNGSTSCNKLYRAELIRNNGIRFQKKVPLGEDALFSVRYMGVCRCIVLSSQITYYYNHIVDNNAMSKYYPDYHLYHTYIFEAGKATICNTANIADRDASIGSFANLMGCNSVYYYISHSFLTPKIKKQLAEVVQYYHPYWNAAYYDDSRVYKISKEELELLSKQDVNGFIKAWKKRQRKERGILFIRFYIRIILEKTKFLSLSPKR